MLRIYKLPYAGLRWVWGRLLAVLAPQPPVITGSWNRRMHAFIKVREEERKRWK